MEEIKVWKKYLIFISSTFRDMDAERDIIKFDVQHRLNERYRKKCIQFQFIDLRIGVNTEGLEEEKAENEVLEICLSNIDKARPFFIALIGNRYGWIPDQERWKFIFDRLNKEKRVLINGSSKKSVTELEILYGAIGNNGEHLDHSLFFFRDENSYKGMPEHILADYDDNKNSRISVETQNLLNNNLNNLKERIVSISEQLNFSGICHHYSLQWNAKNNACEGTEKFADLVYDALCTEIDKEIGEMTSDITWQKEEEMNIAYLLQCNTDGKPTLSEYDRLLELSLRHPRLCITAPTGWGKEVLMAQLFHYYSQKENTICLAAFAGISPYSQTITPILIRWVQQLQKSAGENPIEMENDDKNYPKIKRLFFEAVRKYKEKGIDIVTFLGNISFFEKVRHQDIFLTWTNSDCKLIATALPENAEQIENNRSGIYIYPLKAGGEKDHLLIVQSYERLFNVSLPAAVTHKITTEQGNTPLRIALIMTLLANFSARNMLEIRESDNGASEMEKINTYIEKLYDEAPKSDTALFFFVLHHLCEGLGYGPEYEEMVRFIILSPNGLRESEMERLAPETFHMLHFRTLAFLLKEFIFEHPFSHRWYLRKDINPDEIITHESERQLYYKKLEQVTATLEEDDPQKKSMLFYYAIMAEEPQSSVSFLAAPENSAYFQERYSHAKYYLLNDPLIETRLEAYCDQCNEEQRIRFIYGWIEGVGEIWEEKELQISLVETYLNDISPDTLDIDTAYRWAWIYAHCKQLTEWENPLKGKGESEEKRRFFIQQAIAGFERCYQLDAHYKDVRNMLKAMLMERMEYIMEESSWEEIENYYNQIKKL